MNTFFQDPSGQSPIIIGISTVNVLLGAENVTYTDVHFTFTLDASTFNFGTVNIGVGINLPSIGQIWPAGII
jgi:hypothetical protein